MHYSILHSASGCDNILVSRGGKTTLMSSGLTHDVIQKVAKTLDKLPKLWYNKGVKREAVSNQRSGKLMAPMGDCAKTAHLFN